MWVGSLSPSSPLGREWSYSAESNRSYLVKWVNLDPASRLHVRSQPPLSIPVTAAACAAPGTKPCGPGRVAAKTGRAARRSRGARVAVAGQRPSIIIVLIMITIMIMMILIIMMILMIMIIINRSGKRSAGGLPTFRPGSDRSCCKGKTLNQDHGGSVRLRSASQQHVTSRQKCF